MSVRLYANDETETQNTTSTWVTKLSVSGDLGADVRKYMIWVSAEYTGSATNKIAEIRVLLDGVETNLEQLTPPVTNQIHNFSPMGLIETSGSHTLELQFRAGTLPNTVRCRRARLLIMQH